MHEEPKALLKEAILKCLPSLQALVGKYAAPHRVWTKTGEGRWGSEEVLRPDVQRIFFAADKQLTEAGKPFAESFLARHPEYNGMVGLRYCQTNLGGDITYSFRSAIEHLWRRYETFELVEDTVDSLVTEFESFVDKPTVRFLFRAELLNFQSSGDSSDLPEGLRIRRMTDKEVSAFHGGPPNVLDVMQSRAFGIQEFCVEGETEEPKLFGDQKGDEPPAKDPVKASLDKAILSLRTFKEGHVGYNYIHFYPVTFCPLTLPSVGYGDLYVPFGRYILKAEEFEALAEHAKMVFGVSEPSMEMACSRLADAETRTKPRDRLLDAVIGMEALLLAGHGGGELSFRFSLRYSTLFGKPEERHRAFGMARNLYDLRSKISHGSTLRDRAFSVGDEELKLPEAAKRACETLRHLIRHFLPTVSETPYRKHEFWERACFGLPNE